MASSFIDTFQNLASSISSDKNCFTWDSSVRKFQYGIAGITVAALSILENTNKMQCSTPSPSYPEYYYASTYCHEATWYYINNATNSKEPYDDVLRYFKWYVLIPPLLTIISAVLYGALVDSFVVQALKSARKIINIWNTKIEDSSTIEGTSAINNAMLNMASCAREFSETNMHYRNNKNYYVSCVPMISKKCAPSNGESRDRTELSLVGHSSLMEEKKGIALIDKLGHKTALYYHLYLAMCIVINICALALINPYFFWFPNAIACEYRKEDLTFHWSICSVPGHRYSRVAVIISMLDHLVGVLVTVLSFLYLNYYIPKEILTANVAISIYTRHPKQQEKILQCWRKYGREKMKTLTPTTRFLLALIYQNIDRSLCYRLVLAMVDIEKDKDAIDLDLPDLIKQIVDIDMQYSGVLDEDKEEKINEIRETVLNPVGTDRVKDNIQSNILIKLVGKYLDNPNSTTELFQAQQIHRITGVQLPKLSRGIKNIFSNLIQEKEESDFGNSVEYSRFLSALYDLTKSKHFFNLRTLMEIGKLSDDESVDNIIDNGHVTVEDESFDAKRAFDTSGYCWRSSDVTTYNWIKRTWNQEYTIKLIAIQGSHVNEKSTPIHFNFTAKLKNPENEIIEWKEVSEPYRSYDWLKDEWRVFSIFTTDKQTGTVIHPRTQALQINIFNNGGAEYFEIQNIKIFGSN